MQKGFHLVIMNNADSAYTHLAQYYDRLMDVDYEEWAEYLRQIWEKLGCKPKQILELACGTGGVTIPLAQMGYEITAVDISAEMVAAARAKAEKHSADINFIVNSMHNLDLGQQFDLTICCCDSVNYLTTDAELDGFIKQAYAHTKPGGLLLFDLNSELKLREIYGNQSYAELDEDFGFFWDNCFDEQTEICTMDLTFFIKVKDGLYRRVREVHREKLWYPQVIFERLQNQGWEIVGYFQFLTFAEPEGEAERWQFAARKPIN
jgi:SAM-dependent methyltransferase